MKATIEMVLKQNLKALKLSTMCSRLEDHIRQASQTQQNYEEFLLGLTDIELQIRAEHRLKRRLKEARFPLMKTLDTFQFEHAAGLDARHIRELSTGEYIRAHHNVILFGNSGTGKTHLATALGVEACKEGFRTRFITGCELVNELVEAQEERVLSRLLKRYASYDLLILDELGYVPFSKLGAELLFQVLAERHERTSVIVTTNLGFADWTQIFGEANLTAALLDRVTHRASIITCSWKSYRLQDSLKHRGSPLPGSPRRGKHISGTEIASHERPKGEDDAHTPSRQKGVSVVCGPKKVVQGDVGAEGKRAYRVVWEEEEKPPSQESEGITSRLPGG